MYKPRDIIEFIANNVRKTRNPFGAPKFLINRWWKDVDLKPEGDALLFTGLMYQFVPYVETTTAYLERYEDTNLANYVGYGRYMPKLFMGLGLALMTPKEAKKTYDGILHNIVRILARSDVDFYYRTELDHYSGVLLYDLGDLEGFVRHARFVARNLKENGVRKLITVDPHTTYAMKLLYPKYTGEEFEVKTYFELVDFQGDNGVDQVTLHDPCIYGRYLGLADVPVRVLDSMGIQCMPVRNSGAFTNCCGGPVESLSPRLTKEVVARRVQELQSTGAPIVAMCPICVATLKRGGAEVEDLSTVIARCA